MAAFRRGDCAFGGAGGIVERPTTSCFIRSRSERSSRAWSTRC